MYRVDYDSVNDFLKNICLNDFPLIDHYLHYDEGYMDDNWIRYSIFYKDNTNNPICVIAKRLPEEEIGHILILEVKKDLKRHGYGKEAINMYMKDKPYWDLFSTDEAVPFYKSLGFKKDKETQSFYFGFEI